ncbi:MAG: Flp pilus assembly complex ATPase component TadA [Selenomonadaceae bacterium]|nr:Flp pilus assembly complex ATPase component TadA [Selenomonadaceae bacterium]
MAENRNLDVVLGAGVVDLMHRDDVTEIYNNDDGFIRYQSHTEGKVKTDLYLTPEQYRAIIELVAGQVGKVVNEDVPSLSAEIAGYGCRFQGELPPIVRTPQMNIRKKAVRIFSLADYVRNGVLTETYKEYIEKAIAARKNLLIVGGTGTGKTTFLNGILAAIAEISPYHRIISLEDLPELQCPAEDYSPMFTKQDTGQGGIRYNMTRLLADCMRRSPDRIVVGEVRDGAAYTMLKAWNTGHEGGACTVHANGAVEGLTRIKSLAQEDPDAAGDIKELIGEAVDVVIAISHVELTDGRKSRIVKDVIEVSGYDSMTDSYRLRHIGKAQGGKTK